MTYEIRDVLYSVTNFCLGSCQYCQIKNLQIFDYDKEANVADFERFISDPYLDNVKNIHLTGGEPVLSPKLWGIVNAVKKHHPDIRANMPVSGFFPYATYRYLKKIHEVLPQLRIDISVDGTSAEVHEKTRGKGSWEPLNKTIELLRSIEGLKIQFEQTLMESNVGEIKKIQEWARSLNVGFFLCFPKFGTRFGHSFDGAHEHSQEFIDTIEEQIKDDWCKIRPQNAMIWLCQKAIWQHKTVFHDCLHGLKSLDVSPDGTVYPCMVYDKRQTMGNIKTQSLTEILESERAKKVLDGIKERKCQPCTMPECFCKENFVVDGKRMRYDEVQKEYILSE